MKIAFRTDASIQIGTGHFMRCLAFAEELKKNHEIKILFICQNLPFFLKEMLSSRGIELKLLKTNSIKGSLDELVHSKWLDNTQANDAQLTLHVLANKSYDWIVVDHYALDKRWESAVRLSCSKLMVLDDLADRHHDCDVLLDQNFYPDMESRYRGKVPSDCQLLIGPSFALLREEFRKQRDLIKPRIGEVKKILVFFGGVDAYNYTGLALKALVKLNVKQHVDVVIGVQHPYSAQIQQMCEKNNFLCHVQTSRMSELMAASDLAIGAGGSASWERCCLGLPALILATADNQIEIAKALDSINVCSYVRTKNNRDLIAIHNSIKHLLNAPSQINKLSNESFMLVDGKGVSRVSKELGF